MGTSQAYSGFSKNPNWRPLSSSLTNACHDGIITKSNLSRITSRFVNLLGGSAIGGRGGSKIGGKAGIRTSKKFGGFLGEIKTKGFSQALINSGFVYDGTQTANDVINHLLEYCAGVAASLDDTAAKEAERKLLEEISSGAQTFEELEKNFQAKMEVYGTEELLIKYYGYYIYEHLSIDFYEKLIKDKGKDKCGNLYSQLKDFIFERIKNISKKMDLSKIDWNSENGDRIIKNIFEDTLKAFEDYEN